MLTTPGPGARLFIAALLLLLTTAAAAEVRVGVLAFRGSEQAVASWDETVAYLDQQLPGHGFRVIPLDLDELREAVAENRVDFVLTNPGHYVELEAAFGIARVATVESAVTDDARYSIGSAIVVRHERDELQALGDLAGRSLLAVAPDAFGGFQIAVQALRQAGVDPGSDLTLRFVGFPMDAVAYAVAAGEADAGVLRACLLEQMIAEGRIEPGRLRVLGTRDHFGFRCAASTELYPDWPFAKTRTTSRQLAKQVAQALFAMPAGHPAAAVGRYVGWTIPVDYQPVHELFRELGIGPYVRDDAITLRELLEHYWEWLAMLLLAAVWMVWHVARVEQQVRLRTAQLSAANERLKAAMQEQAAAEEKIRQHEAELAHADRVHTMGELAAGLAHEINQPLAAIGNYAEGCLVRLRQQDAAPELVDAIREIDTQAARAGAIVHQLRGFLRKEAPRPVPVDINAAVVNAVSLFTPEARRHRVSVKTQLGLDLPLVCGELIQVEQVILNLLRNGMEAMEEAGSPHRELVATTATADGSVRVTVRDSGPGLSEEAKRRVFEPFFTTKAQGMGLGLSISHSIIEAHGGRLQFEDAPGGGAEAVFTLPVARKEEDDDG